MKKKYYWVMALAAFTLTGYANDGLNPARWYKFESITDNVVKDEVAPAENGTVVGMLTQTDGRDGKALVFGKEGAYVDLNEVSLLKEKTLH